MKVEVSQSILIVRAFSLGFFLGAVTVWFLASDDVGGEPSPPPSFSLRSNNYMTMMMMTEDGYATPSESDRRGLLAEGRRGQLTRHVHVGTMCRCASGLLPVPGPPMMADRVDTVIVQRPSLATGIHAKRFVMHRSEGGCSCVDNTKDENDPAGWTSDMFLKKMELHKCPRKYPTKYGWDNMPDLGVEEGLPVFLGVLSHESPLSLNATMRNFLDHDLFRRVRARDVFVRLNRRSPTDDEILQKFRQTQRLRNRESPLTVLGSPTEDLHHGLAIADFCRRAESHPSSHPNGENLLVFLAEGWRLVDDGPEDPPSSRTTTGLEELLRGINALAQRGVPYVRLERRSDEVPPERTWPCPARGFPFECATAGRHRWTDGPAAVRCDWFLRYLEPFALLDDPIMHGCRRPGFEEDRRCDWEEALRDGRIAWTEAQWVVASLMTGRHRLFFHRGGGQ